MKLDKFISNISGVWILAFALFIIIGGELGSNNSASVENQTTPSVVTSSTTVPKTTTTTVPKTTTTTVPKTTTTTIAEEGYGLSVFKTKREYFQHKLDMTFYEGFRGYEGDFVINNGWQDKNCDASRRGGCKSLFDNFPGIFNVSLSLPYSGGNRAFGEISIEVPEDYRVTGVSITLQACKDLSIRCVNDFGYSDYEVLLTEFDYRAWKFGEVIEYIYDLVGYDDPVNDTNFFYPGYFYFVDKITLQIEDYKKGSDSSKWTGIVEYRVVGGVGTYAWQLGWDAPVNLGWVNPSYTFLWSSFDTFDRTPYFRP